MAPNTEEKILLTLDGSEFALEGVKYISKIPSLQDRRIVLFSVYNKIPEKFLDLKSHPGFGAKILEVESWEIQKNLDLESYMSDARQVLLNAGFSDQRIDVRIQEMKTGPARDIIREAKDGYQAVVAGKRGWTRLTGIVLGSVAMKLLQGVSFAPLILVGKDVQPGKVLLGFDGSEGAMNAIRAVGALLGTSDWEVNLLCVIRLGEEKKELIQEAEREMGIAFEQALDILKKAGFPPARISTRIITGAQSRSQTIVSEAGQKGCGTITVGRRGLSRISEFFMGRVSNKVVHLARGHAILVAS